MSRGSIGEQEKLFIKSSSIGSGCPVLSRARYSDLNLTLGRNTSPLAFSYSV
jgi:hypothetical protein